MKSKRAGDFVVLQERTPSVAVVAVIVVAVVAVVIIVLTLPHHHNLARNHNETCSNNSGAEKIPEKNTRKNVHIFAADRTPHPRNKSEVSELHRD